MNATRPGDDRPVDGTVAPRPGAGTDPHPSTADPADAAPAPGERSDRAADEGGRDLPAGYEPL
ncbi:hypothetical protein AB0K15_05490 [Amycolatopsis sp. NPDC049253]|uniref:hypothetical protein n=1 Tax=Amycolatopsis sp. NPDC049253 TaxID=3155274 RepID=UPI003444BC62